MNWIDKQFWKYAGVLEHIGDFTGIGYEVTNIIIFFVLQPTFTILFIILWLRERRKNKKLSNVKPVVNKSIILNVLWRLSRLLSVGVVLLEIFLIYAFYRNVFQFSFPNFIREEILNSIIVATPIGFLMIYNFIIFGKVSVWLKKPY